MSLRRAQEQNYEAHLEMLSCTQQNTTELNKEAHLEKLSSALQNTTELNN